MFNLLDRLTRLIQHPLSEDTTPWKSDTVAELTPEHPPFDNVCTVEVTLFWGAEYSYPVHVTELDGTLFVDGYLDLDYYKSVLSSKLSDAIKATLMDFQSGCNFPYVSDPVDWGGGLDIHIKGVPTRPVTLSFDTP